MNANRTPLVAIGTSAMEPIIVRRKPQLTYSSVIHSLVERLTKRSAFLHGDSFESDVALLSREEVHTGELLGQGNFSNVFEVSDLRICPEQQLKKMHGFPKAHQSQTTSKAMDGEEAEQRRARLKSDLRRNDGRKAYAIKCLKPELLDEPSPKLFLEAATDLVIEAKYLSRFNHENILKLRGMAQGWESAFADGEYDSFFIVVDRLEETLNKRIKRWRNGELREENTIMRKLPIARQLASALSYLADRQLLFRDCKPQNIGVKRDAKNRLSIKLFDFGFCRQLPVADQARDDIEDSEFSELPSGETVFLMSGKGTRRYMAPECLIQNKYNLKADCYSFAMVFWELLTLHKPYYKYSKDQHTLLVCEGGDRPPLESSNQSIWPTASLHSLSASLSSMPSSISSKEDSINFEAVMTDSIRELLAGAWHQDVSKRCTMKQVVQTLDIIIEQENIRAATDATLNRSFRDLLNLSAPAQAYSCLSSAMAEYGGVSDIVAELADDLSDLPFMTCFGHPGSNLSEQHSDEPTIPVLGPKDSPKQTEKLEQNQENETPEQQTNKTTQTKSSLFSFPQLRPLLV